MKPKVKPHRMTREEKEKRQQKEASRKLLLAAEVFLLSFGIAPTIAELSRLAQVDNRKIYDNFGDLEGLFSSLFKKDRQRNRTRAKQRGKPHKLLSQKVLEQFGKLSEDKRAAFILWGAAFYFRHKKKRPF